MTPGNDEIKYKSLFNKIEDGTKIPGFDAILNFPVMQKRHPGKLVRVVSVMILCLTLVAGIYFHQGKRHGAGVSKNETAFSKDAKALVWEWKSPTQQLLSTAVNNTFTDFSTPTDCLSPLKTSLENNYNKKTN